MANQTIDLTYTQLGPFFVDSAGNIVNTGTGSTTANGIQLGPNGTVGVRLTNSQAGTLRVVTADNSANATVQAFFRVAALDGTVQLTDNITAGLAGIRFFYDGTQTTNQVYMQTLRERQIVASKTTSYTVLLTDTSTYFDNFGAAGTVTYTLPTATLGQQYYFVSTTPGQAIAVQPQAGDTMAFGTKTSGQPLTSAAGKAAYLEVVCTAANTWAITAISASPAWT